MLETHVEDVSPGDLRFTQTSIAIQFKGDYKDTTLDSAVTMLKTRQRSPADFGKLVVVYHEGLLWSVNNRRLYVFRRANVSRVNVTVLKSSPEDGLQAVIKSPRGLGPLTKNDKDNLQKLIDEPAHRRKLETAQFLPYVRRKGRGQQLDAPSNNQRSEIWMVKNRNTTSRATSSSSIPKFPLQPNHASMYTSAMTQLLQSRQPQDRGSTSKLPAAPSNNQRSENMMVKNRNTTSSSSIPKFPVQPNHASMYTIAMTQLLQSRQPQDRGSISRLPAAPSNNQRSEDFMVKDRNTTSSSSIRKFPVQPIHDWVNASAMTQLPQSRQPQDRGSTSRLPALQQEFVKRPMIPVVSGPEIRRPTSITYSTFEAYEPYKYRRIDQASPDHDEQTPGFGSLQAYWNRFLRLLLCCDCLPYWKHGMAWYLLRPEPLPLCRRCDSLRGQLIAEAISRLKPSFAVRIRDGVPLTPPIMQSLYKMFPTNPQDNLLLVTKPILSQSSVPQPAVTVSSIYRVVYNSR